MIKVENNLTSSVRVMNKHGQSVYVPKSQIILDEKEENIVSAKSWIIEEKQLDKENILVDETIGLRVSKEDEDKCIVYLPGLSGKSYNRKLYYFKKYNMYALNFKTNVFAFPKNDENIFARENGLIHIGNQKDGYSFENQVEEYFVIKQKVEEIKIVEPNEPIIQPIDYTKPVKHMEYETIKTCVENDIPVYLYGPAGSGKNHTLQQIAEDLDLEFYFTNSVQQEFKITGFIDAGGKYHETEFYKAFVNGGLFFLDEMDASIPEVLVLLNAAIANGYFEFPTGKEFADPGFRVVAAGNTIGSGADEQYTGRLVLDQATLDRFVSIKFDYDKNIELHLAKGNKDLVDFIRDLRAKSEDTGVRATFSYRAITNVDKLEKTGLEISKILMIAVFKGMDQDTLNTLKKYMSSNKYFQAMNKIVVA